MVNLLKMLIDVFTMFSSALVIFTVWQTLSSSATLIKFIIVKRYSQEQFMFMVVVGDFYSHWAMLTLQTWTINKVQRKQFVFFLSENTMFMLILCTQN